MALLRWPSTAFDADDSAAAGRLVTALARVVAISLLVLWAGFLIGLAVRIFLVAAFGVV
jgi:hypothetical protein